MPNKDYIYTSAVGNTTCKMHTKYIYIYIYIDNSAWDDKHNLSTFAREELRYWVEHIKKFNGLTQ